MSKARTLRVLGLSIGERSQPGLGGDQAGCEIFDEDGDLLLQARGGAGEGGDALPELARVW
jgi:hypothetical protein